jgi:hypothetical protein
MAIDFPDSPSVNDTFTAGGKVYQWDGTVWEIYGPNVSPGTFKIDDVNNRVGINNASPSVTLDVTGDAAFSGNLAVGANTDVEASIDAVEADVTNINELQQNSQTASYTLALSDAGSLVKMNVASANDLTVPPNSSVAFPIGTQILVLQQGAGQTTIVAGSGVSLFSKDSNLKLSARWCVATLIKLNTDNWLVVGDLTA